MAAIHWGDIAQILWAAPLAGIGVTVLYSIGLYGSTKAAEASRDGNARRTAVFSGVALFAFLAFAAALVLGFVVILNK